MDDHYDKCVEASERAEDERCRAAGGIAESINNDRKIMNEYGNFLGIKYVVVLNYYIDKKVRTEYITHVDYDVVRDQTKSRVMELTHAATTLGVKIAYNAEVCECTIKDTWGGEQN